MNVQSEEGSSDQAYSNEDFDWNNDKEWDKHKMINFDLNFDNNNG